MEKEREKDRERKEGSTTSLLYRSTSFLRFSARLAEGCRDHFSLNLDLSSLSSLSSSSIILTVSVRISRFR